MYLPEVLEVDAVPAGFWRRFLAMVIDCIVAVILVFAVNSATGFLLTFGFVMILGAFPLFRALGGDVAAGIIVTMFAYIIAGFFIVWIYSALMESSKLQATLGKMAVGLKVTNLEGKRIGFALASGRYFGKLLSWLTCCIGFFMAGWTDRKQALHDKIAGTLVIKSDA